MDIQEDFKELLELFNDHDVEFLVVGGYALAFHGYAMAVLTGTCGRDRHPKVQYRN